MKQYATDETEGSTTGADIKDSSELENTKSDESSDTEQKPVGEDALEMHYMSAKQRRAYKRSQYKEKTDSMSFAQKAGFLFDYYKWQFILTVSLIVCVCLIGRTVYLNTRPLALGLITINNAEPETGELSDDIEADYRQAYDFDKHDRFIILTGLSIKNENYERDVISSGSSGLSDYETLFYQTSAGSIDVILTDAAGMNYCVDQDLVYPMDVIFTEEELAPYQDRIIKKVAYTGDRRDYAVNVSDSAYLEKLSLDYDTAYVLFPANTEENKQRALKFLDFLLQP